MAAKKKIKTLTFNFDNSKKIIQSFFNSIDDTKLQTTALVLIVLIILSYYYYILKNPEVESIQENLKKMKVTQKDIDTIVRNYNSELEDYEYELQKSMIERLLNDNISENDIRELKEMFKVIIDVILLESKNQLNSNIKNDLFDMLNALTTVSVDNLSISELEKKSKGKLYQSMVQILKNKLNA